MADKLSITIALEGGKAIEQQLADIGKAGQQAFQDISKAAAEVGGFKNLKPEEVTAKLQQMGITGKEALDKISGAVQEATRLEKLVGVVQTVEKGFAGLSSAAGAFVRSLGPIGTAAGVIGGALVKAATDAAEAIHKIDTAAIKAGLSIEKFDQLKKGFEAAGISAGAFAEGIGKIGSAVEQAKLDQVAAALKAIQDRPGTGQGSAAWQILVETVQGVGPAADAARAALEKLGAFNIPLGPVQTIKNMMASTGDAAAAARLFIAELEKMPDSLNRNATATALLGQALGTEVIQTLRTGNLTVEQFNQVVSTLTQSQANAANSMTQSWNKLSAAWTDFKTALGAKLITETDVQMYTDILNGISTLLNATGKQWADALGQIWQPFQDAGTAAINAIMGLIDGLIAKVKAIGSGIGGIFGGGGTPGETTPIPGNAAGGLIGGSGSGTSDSNLAWVSRGEHIMPASVVSRPGVLALLEQLRHGMGSFALGGVVGGLPRFADGGLVGHLGTVDLRTDHGSVTLMAGSSAVEQLSRLAVTRRMTSTGRKPGFIS